MPLADSLVPETDSGADRRIAPRLKPEQVPWISGVKASAGDNSALLDISSTGLLMETRVRMIPGRRHAVTLEGPEGATQRVEGLVVRSHLVAFKGGGPVYRTALKFTEALDLPSGAEPDADWTSATAAAEPAAIGADADVEGAAAGVPPLDLDAAAGSASPSLPVLEGPFDGLWATESRSAIVSISHITEMTCFVYTSAPVTLDQWVSLSIFFSGVRRLVVMAKVSQVVPNTGCVLRFVTLSADERRALRVEIRGRCPEATASRAATRRRLLTEAPLASSADSESATANCW
jgi:hypothetical protein